MRTIDFLENPDAILAPCSQTACPFSVLPAAALDLSTRQGDARSLKQPVRQPGCLGPICPGFATPGPLKVNKKSIDEDDGNFRQNGLQKWLQNEVGSKTLEGLAWILEILAGLWTGEAVDTRARGAQEGSPERT